MSKKELYALLFLVMARCNCMKLAKRASSTGCKRGSPGCVVTYASD